MKMTALILLASFISLSVCAGKVSVVDHLPADQHNTNYPSNQKPLLPSPMERLPLGAIQAEGWLKHQLELMADGQIGRLEEISNFLKPNSGWLGGKERGWEEAAYWFRGFYDLATLTRDPRLKSSAAKWIEAVVESQTEDGYYGAQYNRLVKGKNNQSIVDIWPHMVMNEPLISHYEATGDERVIKMLTHFFAFCRDLPDELFLPEMSWDYYENYRENFGDWKPRIQFKRAGEFVPQLIWLYNRTGEEWMLDFAVKVYHKTQPPLNQWLDNHTVHFSQRFRYPAQLYPITGDERYLKATDYFYDSFYKMWGQMPRGAHAADERIRMGRIDPRQAIETCSLSELNMSHYILGRITGAALYGDRVEDITFNHMPASHRPDHRSLRYLTACNMPYSVAKMDFHNKGAHPVFAADMHRCCQHNAAMSWPRFTRNLWQASSDNGLIAWLYAPNTLGAKVGEKGTPVRIKTQTQYPFRDTVEMELSSKVPTEFPLYLRIPGWCNSMEVEVNGEKHTLENQGGHFARISKQWENGDKIRVKCNQEITVTQWPRTGAVTVDRGPLSYSVKIDTRWEKTGGQQKWPRWSAKPNSPWNYGLALDLKNPGKQIVVELSEKVDASPWQVENAPITLKVPARLIPDWVASRKNTVDAVREGPVRSTEKLETIEMIPLGCAHLRMSVLPIVSDSKDAREWKDIPDPGVFMLERLTN